MENRIDRKRQILQNLDDIADKRDDATRLDDIVTFHQQIRKRYGDNKTTEGRAAKDMDGTLF